MFRVITRPSLGLLINRSNQAKFDFWRGLASASPCLTQNSIKLFQHGVAIPTRTHTTPLIHSRAFSGSPNIGETITKRFETKQHSPERILPEQDEPAPQSAAPALVYQHNEKWRYRLATTVGCLQSLMCSVGLYRAWLFPDASFGIQVVGLSFAGALLFLAHKHGKAHVNKIGVYADYPRAPVIVSTYTLWGGERHYQVPRSALTGVPSNFDMENVRSLTYLPLFVNHKAPFRLPRSGQFHKSNLFFNVLGYTIPDLMRCPPSAPSLMDIKAKSPEEFERIMAEADSLAKIGLERQKLNNELKSEKE